MINSETRRTFRKTAMPPGIGARSALKAGEKIMAECPECSAPVSGIVCRNCGLVFEKLELAEVKREDLYDIPNGRKRLVTNTPGRGTDFKMKDAVQGTGDPVKWFRLHKLQGQINFKAVPNLVNKIDQQNKSLLEETVQELEIGDKISLIAKEILDELKLKKNAKSLGGISRKTARGVNVVFIGSLLMVLDKQINIVPAYKDRIMEHLSSIPDIGLVRLLKKINEYTREIESFLGNRFKKGSAFIRQSAIIILKKHGITLFTDEIITMVDMVKQDFKRYGLILEYLALACARFVYSYWGIPIPLKKTSTLKKYTAIISRLSEITIDAKVVEEDLGNNLFACKVHGTVIAKKRLNKTDVCIDSACTQGRIQDILQMGVHGVHLVDFYSNESYDGHFGKNRLMGTHRILRVHPEVKEGMWAFFRKQGNDRIVVAYSSSPDPRILGEEEIERPGFVIMKKNKYFGVIHSDQIEEALGIISEMTVEELEETYKLLVIENDASLKAKFPSGLDKNGRAVITSRLLNRIKC